jgi:TPR repeat protein
LGVGVIKDYSEAVKWWRKAAEQNYAVAKFTGKTKGQQMFFDPHTLPPGIAILTLHPPHRLCRVSSYAPQTARISTPSDGM